MAGTPQYTAFGAYERKNMARPTEITGLSTIADDFTDGISPVNRRNAGRSQFLMVDRNSKGRFIRVGALGYHIIKVEIVGFAPRDGNTNESAPIFNHYVDGFSGYLLGGQEKVALILACCIVRDNNHAPLFDIFDS